MHIALGLCCENASIFAAISCKIEVNISKLVDKHCVSDQRQGGLLTFQVQMSPSANFGNARYKSKLIISEYCITKAQSVCFMVTRSLEKPKYLSVNHLNIA